MNKGVWMGAGALASALALTACGKPASDDATGSTNDIAAAGLVNMANVAPPAANSVELPQTVPVTGAFAAVSNTAMSVTGDATISAEKLGFALDQSYATGRATGTTAATPYAGADSWADLFGVAPETPVELRPVDARQVGAKARNGGLCGDAQVRFVALARKAPGTPDELLQIAAFQGNTPPGPGAPPENLCGTFTFMPK